METFEISADELRATPGAVVIDVREADEHAAGSIPGSLHVPRAELAERIGAIADLEADVVVYCQSGTRSALAVRTLKALGYARVRSLRGGIAAHGARLLTSAQAERYARHVRLPEVGEAGQKKLLDAKVLLVGAGGLGSPASLYLAAAGVGTLGLVDDDVVEASNLQRQVVHSTATLGQPKVDSAARTLAALNPDVRVVPHRLRLDADNVRGLVSAHDLVVDGTDNFATRYVLNDAAVALGKTVVHASIHRFEGRVTVFAPGGPCYRCLHPAPPDEGSAPSCEEAGVLGVLPGIIGVAQATEALKLLLGIGEPLVGRLLLYDALAMRFREFGIPRDPQCPVCA